MPRKAHIPTPNEVTDATMMPLSVAAEVAVTHGVLSSATPKALKREADQGRLAVYEVFGRLHTTLGDIKEMLRESVVEPRRVSPIAVSGSRVTRLKQRDPHEDECSPSRAVIRSLRAAAKTSGGKR